MILATELTKYTQLDRYELSKILARSGYTGCSFKSVNFLGITNGGDFCYSVKYFDEHGLGEAAGKVFVSKSATGVMTAEFQVDQKDPFLYNIGIVNKQGARNV